MLGLVSCISVKCSCCPTKGKLAQSTHVYSPNLPTVFQTLLTDKGPFRGKILSSGCNDVFYLHSLQPCCSRERSGGFFPPIHGKSFIEGGRMFFGLKAPLFYWAEVTLVSQGEKAALYHEIIWKTRTYPDFSCKELLSNGVNPAYQSKGGKNATHGKRN